MAKSRSVIDGRWFLFSTPDGREVMVLADDILRVWAGLEKGTLAIECASRDEPLVVCYTSVQAFADDFMTYYDERRKSRKLKAWTGQLKVIGFAEISGGCARRTKKQ